MSHFNSNACDRSFASICSEKLKLEDWKQESKETEMARVWVFWTVLHLVRNLTLQFTGDLNSQDGRWKLKRFVFGLCSLGLFIRARFRDLDTSLLLKRCSNERVIWLDSPDLDWEPGRKIFPYEHFGSRSVPRGEYFSNYVCHRLSRWRSTASDSVANEHTFSSSKSKRFLWQEKLSTA